ncbi:beta-lactamase family protein [Mycobacterium sp. 21AC1]|uniref:serine hydrolase domain-containing protein n=1 Tax=[Mycobacterium] appelbergii TaxID=2939269 RepID=UPI0029391DFA|nr:serine hydrolase domain-containing protein [Mycobacterium sp. 21AC1]MDV3128135.1 beta-lactamase family protein [Mycobacterium sp. 21AC1]
MDLDFSAADDIVAEFHERRRAPGVRFAVVADGRTVHVAGHGVTDCATGARAADERVFRIASMSKSFTAAALLQLRDQGLLRLDDPVIGHLPQATGLGGHTRDSPPITLRHCLTMSSGLPSDDPWADRQESMSQDTFDELLARPVAGAYAPGTAFVYSNLGFAILGRVVEAVTGRDFVGYLTSELLEPLGLTDTTYDYRTVPSGRLANGYRLTRSGDWELQPFSAPGSFSAIGGLLSTTGDIARWIGWLAEAFPAGGGDDAVLARASRRDMQQPHRLVPFHLAEAPGERNRLKSNGFDWGLSGYGYGLFVETDPRWGAISQHLGGYPGFGSYMGWHQDSGLGVVAFANGTYAPVAAPARAALDALLRQHPSRRAEARPTPAMRSALELVERVIAEPTALQEPAFADNVLLDVPLGERVAAITAARNAVGDRDGQAEMALRSPTEATYRLPGTRGRIDVTIALTPTDPPRIHTFAVEAVAAEKA